MSKEYKPLLTWTDEDIRSIAATTNDFRFTDEQIEIMRVELEDELNNWDSLSDMITEAIAQKIEDKANEWSSEDSDQEERVESAWDIIDDCFRHCRSISEDDYQDIIDFLEERDVDIINDQKIVSDFYIDSNWEHIFNWLYEDCSPYEIAQKSSDIDDYNNVLELNDGTCIFWYQIDEVG